MNWFKNITKSIPWVKHQKSIKHPKPKMTVESHRSIISELSRIECSGYMEPSSDIDNSEYFIGYKDELVKCMLDTSAYEATLAKHGWGYHINSTVQGHNTNVRIHINSGNYQYSCVGVISELGVKEWNFESRSSNGVVRVYSRDEISYRPPVVEMMWPLISRHFEAYPSFYSVDPKKVISCIDFRQNGTNIREKVVPPILKDTCHNIVNDEFLRKNMRRQEKNKHFLNLSIDFYFKKYKPSYASSDTIIKHLEYVHNLRVGKKIPIYELNMNMDFCNDIVNMDKIDMIMCN